MDLTVERTVGPTIDPTVEITGQPVRRTQASEVTLVISLTAAAL